LTNLGMASISVVVCGIFVALGLLILDASFQVALAMLCFGWGLNCLIAFPYSNATIHGRGLSDAEQQKERIGTVLIACVPWALVALAVVTTVGAALIQLRAEEEE
jgi:hypothetical protein